MLRVVEEMEVRRGEALHLLSSYCVLNCYLVSHFTLTYLCGLVVILSYQCGCYPREVGHSGVWIELRTTCFERLCSQLVAVSACLLSAGPQFPIWKTRY